MPIIQTRFREVRTYATADDDRLYVFFCFERLPEGGFICPYVESYKNSAFHDVSENSSVLRKHLFAEFDTPQCTVYPTVDAAIDGYDLAKAYKP